MRLKSIFFGPELLESAYEQCLARELSLQGIRFQLQVALPIEYKGKRFGGKCLRLLISQ